MFYATNTFNFTCNPKYTATTGELESHFRRIRDYCTKKEIQKVVLTAKVDMATSQSPLHDELAMFDLMEFVKVDTSREGLQKLTLEMTIMSFEHTIELTSEQITSEQHQFQFQIDAFNYCDSRQKAQELAKTRLAALDVDKYVWGGRRLAWFLDDIGLTSGGD